MTKAINYGRLMHKALRQLIADVLAQVARDGLPGKHHFYITFETRHPGVDMARSLLERYPDEMTIVMQDWFTDLAVMKDRFSVTLNFGNVPEPIVIPFEAIKTFVDPSVEFGLRFDAHEEGAAPGQGKGAMHAGDGDSGEGGPPAPGAARGTTRDPAPEASQGSERDATRPGTPRRGDGEVVSLDEFRKH